MYKMMRYSIQPRDRIVVKGYVFLSFAKNMSKNLGKNISKNLSIKYSHEFLHHDKQSATDALKTTLKRLIQKTAKATGDLIGNKIADKITKISRSSLQNNSERMANEHDEKILEKRHISPEERQKSIDDLLLI